MRNRVEQVVRGAAVGVCIGALNVPGAVSAQEADDAQAGQVLTIDRLVADPSLDGPRVSRLRFSPDGDLVTYLKGREGDFRTKDLWAFDIEDGEARRLADAKTLLGGEQEQLGEVEKARRERQRITGSGIVAYQWAPGGEAILFPLGGDLFLFKPGEGDAVEGEVRRLTQTEATETDPKFSPDGRFVSFVRDSDLFVIDLEDGTESALTTGGDDVVMNARAEFVAQEEMGRTTGYWWAPDSTRIAYARVDLSGVAAVERYELGEEGGVTTITQRYPFAGSDNADVQLRLVSIEGDIDRAIDIGGPEDRYIPRVTWMPDGNRLVVQRQTRDQKRLDLVAVDPVTGERATLLSETSETWVNIHHNPIFLNDGRRFVWTSERSGHPQLYMVDAETATLTPLTAGEWAVTGTPQVDETFDFVYFSANAETPAEQHFYRVPLDPAPAMMTRLTHQPGWHNARVGPEGAFILDRFSAPETPPRVTLLRKSGKQVADIAANPLDDSHPYHPYLAGHAPVEYGMLEAGDGTALSYSLRKPADYDPEKTYPVILSVYGGPGVQRVRKAWQVDFNQVLARQGYVVLKLDNRGATNRGKAFESVLYRRMGRTEVADQLAGLDMLVERGIADPERAGVWGWSYGGYMTLMLLGQAPERFRAGVSVAPVTDWRLYDTHYTERYLGMPDAHEGYSASNVFAHLDAFPDDRLMLVHGMADDNVFFDHSVKLMSALQARRIGFDLMTYPGKRHGIRGEDARAHLWSDALRFFNARLAADKAQ